MSDKPVICREPENQPDMAMSTQSQSVKHKRDVNSRTVPDNCEKSSKRLKYDTGQWKNEEKSVLAADLLAFVKKTVQDSPDLVQSNTVLEDDELTPAAAAGAETSMDISQFTVNSDSDISTSALEVDSLLVAPDKHGTNEITLIDKIFILNYN